MHCDGGQLAVDDWAAPAVRADPALRDAPGARSQGASLNSPIAQDGRVVAILSAQTREPRRWTDEDRELCAELADRLCSTLARARADEALRERLLA